MVAVGVRQSRLLRSLAFTALLATAMARAAWAQGTVVVTFELPSDPVVQVGGPVYLDIGLQNNSSDTVRVNMGHHGKWNYEFTLVEADGTTTPVPPYRQYGPGPKGTVTLRPHETQTRRLLFNEWYLFRRPGDYILKVRLTVLLSSSANVSWQKEFFDNLNVQVAPRDPERLREICAKLAETALGANVSDTTAEAPNDAAFTLSYIVDPVAVPFMARVLKEGAAAVREHSLHGLTRVGNQEAMEVLKSSLASADAELKAKIENALSQFRTGT